MKVRVDICLEGLRKTTKNLGRIAGVPGEIRTGHLPNESLLHYRYTNILSTEIMFIPYKFKFQLTGFLET
jgi:hypothetical protein